MDINVSEQNSNEKIAYFDHTFCNNHIRMMKIFLHYIPDTYRKLLIIYIKFLELQQALKHTTNFTKTPSSSVIQEIMPFCTDHERDQLQNIENMMNNLEQMKNMMEMMDMMKDMFGNEEGGFDPEMLAGMMDFMK